MSGTKNQARPSLQARRCRGGSAALDVMCSARQLRALAATYGASALTVASPIRVAVPLGRAATRSRTWRSVALTAGTARPVSFASATSRAVGCRTEEHARGSSKSRSADQRRSVARPSIGLVESFPKHSGAIMLRTAAARNPPRQTRTCAPTGPDDLASLLSGRRNEAILQRICRLLNFFSCLALGAPLQAIRRLLAAGGLRAPQAVPTPNRL
jgi:hypothetical protein